MNKELLAKVKANSAEVTEIHLSSRDLANSEICDALQQSTVITTVNIGNLYDEKDAKALAKILDKNKSIKKLTIENNDINDAVFKDLVNGILASTTLAHLSVGEEKSESYSLNSKLTKEIVPAIAQLLESDKLASLSISRNSIGSWIDLDPLVEPILKTTKLKTIQLGNNKKLKQVLKQHIELRNLTQVKDIILVIKEYWRYSENFSKILDYLKENPQLEAINFSGKFEDIRYNLPTQSFKVFIENIDACKNLMYLDISYNNLTNESMDLLLPLLRKIDIVTLNLSGNQFSDEAITKLADWLKGNKTIVNLDLSGTLITSRGALAIAKALGNHKSLCRLSLRDCTNIDRAGVDNFIDEVNRNGSLIYIELPVPPPQKLTKMLTKNIKNKDQLILEVSDGKMSECRRLIGLNVSPYVMDETGNVLLHIAVKKNHQKLAKYFLTEVSVNRKIRNHDFARAEDLDNAKQDPALLELFSQPTPPANTITEKTDIRSFFDKKREAPNDNNMNNNGESSNANAALAINNPSTKKMHYSHDEQKAQALYYSAMNGQVDRVRSLINELPVDCKSDIIGETALHAAVRSGNVEIVKLLIQYGADLMCRNRLDQTPLHLACDNSNPKNTFDCAMELLKAEKCDVNAVDKLGLTPLYTVAGGFVICTEQNKHKAEIAWHLVRKGADMILSIFDIETGIDKMTALHKAVMRGYYSVVKAQLSSTQCPLNAQNARGRTALHEAVDRLDVDIVERLLLEPKLDITIRDADHKTAVDISKSKNASDAAEKIRSLIAKREERRLLGSTSRITLTRSLDLYYGKRGKAPLCIEGDREHASLKASISPNLTAGNEVIASLTFIIAKPNESRSALTINLQGNAFHVTDAWQERTQIGGNRPRSRDALQRIITRHEQAPQEARGRCTDQAQPNTPLSTTAIKNAFENSNTNPSFEYLFHHSEQGLYDFLENSKAIEIITQNLKEKLSPGSKIYPMIILRLHSKFYVCANCEVGMLGFQNPEQSKFLLKLQASLEKLDNIRLSKHHTFRLVVSISAEKPARDMPFKNIEEHEDVHIDLRSLPEHIIIERTVEPTTKDRTFSSRKK